MQRGDPPKAERRGRATRSAIRVGLAFGTALGALTASGAAHGAEGGKTEAVTRYAGDARYRRCLDASDGTNTAWAQCGGELISREDGRMNAA